jgi:hypothetical protein
MPIDYKQYHPDWASISHQIRVERAENRCEWCKAPNGETIARGQGANAGTYMLKDGRVFDADDGKPITLASTEAFNVRKHVKIILTVAHIDHNETDHNVPPERLAALCQRCHLNLDRRDNYHRRFHRGQFALEFASYPFYAPLRPNN